MSSLLPVFGSGPTTKTCDICGINKALTKEGKLFQVLADAPNAYYRRMFCSDCIRLFNQGWWPKVKKQLKMLRFAWHLPRQKNPDKLKRIEQLVSQPNKRNSLTAQQIWAIINDIEIDEPKLPRSLRMQGYK